jgi:5'-nucleotidase
MRLRSLVPLVCLTLSCAPASLRQREPVQIVLAATTDLHGWIDGHEEEVATLGGRKLRSGGLDVLGGYLTTLRRHHPGRVVLLDAGDLFQGTLASNLAEGAPVVDAYEILGYDAATIGNHEFDYGPVGERSTAQAGDDPVGALKVAIKRAHFPFLLANVEEKATGKRPEWARPWVMLRRDGVDIGVIGVTTTDTPVVTNPINVAHLSFTDPVAAIKLASAELRAAGAEVIVVAAHLGGGCSDVSDPHNNTSCDQDSEVFGVARRLSSADADVIFAGHTHARLRTFINGIAIAQAYPLGRGLALVDVWVDRGKVQKERTTLRPLVNVCREVFAGTESCIASRGTKAVKVVDHFFQGAPVLPDPRITPVLAPHLARVEAKMREPLSIRVTETFARDYVYESSLGDLIADVIRKQIPKADFAVINSGGLRADLRGPDVTFGDIFEVLPFDNSLATIVLSGRELREMLRLGTLGRHGILQVSGLRMRLDDAKDAALPFEQRDRIVEVTTSDGQPLDPDRIYTIATTDFVASGGDGTIQLIRTLPPANVKVHEELKLREIVIEDLQKRSRVAPLRPQLEGRITYVSAPTWNGS